ncbi:MAG: alcohol dehydrogenase catalytic domain-containing protein [Synergistaceae bacterium]|nr:alcohol dehydrogenase catalytic domain-containing protein [Synergistaceae bacterium]
MKHIIAQGPKKSVIVDVPEIKPNEDQILIKHKYVGVCMSEHYAWSVAKQGEAFGHEPMGLIVALGKNVRGFAVGDRVSGSWGGSLPGSGCMIEYAVADPQTDIVVKLPDNARDEDLILEPLACMVSAVSKVKCPIPGTKVAIVGAGYMGCGVSSLLKLRGASVVAIDTRKESLENVVKYGGADEVYLVGEAEKKFLNNSYQGFDVVMEWAETNESLDLAINLTKTCGQLCVGAYHTGGKRLIDMQQLNVKAIECLSVHPREWDLLRTCTQNAADIIANGAWRFINVPVKVYPMSKFDLAHEELETKFGKHMKAIIDMEKADGEPFIV